MQSTGKYRDLISSYGEANQLFRTPARKIWFVILLAVLALAPWVGVWIGGSYVPYLMNLTAITVIIALGLNFLSGITGLFSLGHAAFFAVGAYSAGYLASRWSIPFFLTVPLASAITAATGLIVGLPALRLKGHYLILGTIAFQFITDFLILRTEAITGGANGLAVPAARIASFEFHSDLRFYYLVVPIVVLLGLGMANLMRSKFGRACIAIRECDVAAEAVGVSLARYKTLSFAISAAYAGIAGALFAHYLGYIGPDHFTILLSIEFAVMIIVGGIGSILGAVLGAAFITLLPEALKMFEGAILSAYPDFVFPDLRILVVGLVLILFILFEPKGLAELWRRLKDSWDTWPFSH